MASGHATGTRELLSHLLNFGSPKSPGEVWSMSVGKRAVEQRCDPTAAWQMLQTKSPLKVVKSLVDPSKPCPENHTRFVCLSDTHHRTSCIKFEVPWGHVLLHAGDFTDVGQPKQVAEFNEFLGALPHEHKIVIAGNHDMSFDSDKFEEFKADGRFGGLRGVEASSADVKKLLTNCTYLEDSAVAVRGFRIYGSPWQPEFCDWGFNLPRGDPCLEKWKQIPSDTDILITHGPPIGHGDLCRSQLRAGCVDLLREIQTRIRPSHHIFGHIHEGYGVTTDGVTTFINASTCDYNYRPEQLPVVFDLPNPETDAEGDGQ